MRLRQLAWWPSLRLVVMVVAEVLITRPSSDVALRVLRERLTVVAGAVEQMPADSPVQAQLRCARDTYVTVIAMIDGGGSVSQIAEVLHQALHIAVAFGSPCCRLSLGDALTALGGGHE